MKKISKLPTTAEFDNFSKDYNVHMKHPLRDFASNQDDSIFPEHKSAYLAWLFQQLFKNKHHLALLDFGCGNGSLLKCLVNKIQNFSLNLYGTDISSGMIKEAKIAWQNQNQFAQFDILSEGKAPYKTESFDIVIASSVFHHIKPLKHNEVLQEIHRVLKPGTYFLMIEHNPFNPITNYIVKHTPMDINAILLNPFEAKKLIQNNKFQHIRTDYILFFPPKMKKLWIFERYIRWFIFGGQFLFINKKLS